MMRILRYSSLFRSIMHRTSEVLPTLVGPGALVVSAMHIFNAIGMVLWCGAVTIGKHKKRIQPLYDLNNFNSYSSGLLTIFNILIVNDWQAIANVYLHADRCYSPYIVYPFFILVNLVGVSILLNVLTAFFIGAFVAKVESRQTQSISLINGRHVQPRSTLDEEISSELQGEVLHQFRIFQRQGFDDVMKTVTGSNDGVTLAKRAVEVLQHFEALSLVMSDKIAYVTCCHQSNMFFGNRAFVEMTKAIEDETLYTIIGDLFSKLMFPIENGLDTNGESAKNCVTHNLFEYELSFRGTMMHRGPPVALFVITSIQNKKGD